MEEPLLTLNRQWKATCKVIFGREIGELKEYENWLLEGLEPARRENSTISGKEVFAVGQYAQASRFVGLEEVGKLGKETALELNDIKDIDSIIRAIGENFVYTGNIILGNSSLVEKSTGLEDCNVVYHSHTNHSSQYVAYFSMGRVDRCVFGCCGTGEATHCIKTQEIWKASRCLGTNRTWECAGIYYSHALFGCSDCMFSFNMRGKRHLIGNIQLTPDKYSELKAKLVEELASELERKKQLPTLFEMVPKGKPGLMTLLGTTKHASGPEVKEDMMPIERAFAETSEVVLSKPLKLGALKAYLGKHVRGVNATASCLSGLKVYYSDMGYDKAMAATGRLITIDEQNRVSEIRKWPRGLDEKCNMEWIKKLIDEVALFCPHIDIQSSNMPECLSVQNSHACYHSARVYFTKYSAYCFWPRDSDRVFGCDAIRNSSFCINCYSSYKLTRCFEADTSQNCTGSYFIHNCENVHDSIFCFNTKNKRYAIANQEVGREQFLRIKKLTLDDIVSRLERNGEIKQSIYNLGVASGVL